MVPESPSSNIATSSNIDTTEPTSTASPDSEVGTTFTAGFPEDTFYRLSNQFLSDTYSLAIRNEYENGTPTRNLNMTISSDNSRQYWQIKRIPDTDDRYWFACRFLGKDVRLAVPPSNIYYPLMAEADNTAIGQQWNVKSMADRWIISNAYWHSGAKLSTFFDTYELFMDMGIDTGTEWIITEVRKITAADNFL